MPLLIPLAAGELYQATVTAPAAGDDVLYVFPNGYRYEVIFFSGRLTAAVGGGVRQPTLRFERGAVFLTHYPATSTVAATANQQYNWVGGFPAHEWTPPNAIFNGLPANLCFAANDNLLTATAGIAAADQWSALVLTLRRWPEKTV